MSALHQITSGPVLGQIHDVSAHHEFPFSETERQAAKHFAQYLAELGKVLIVVIRHSFAVPFANQGEGTTDPCRYPIISEKFE